MSVIIAHTLRRWYCDGTKVKREIWELVSLLLFPSLCPRETASPPHAWLTFTHTCGSIPQLHVPHSVKAGSTVCPELLIDSDLNMVSPKSSASRAKRLSGDFSFRVHCDVKATSPISRPFNVRGGLPFVIQSGNSGPELNSKNESLTFS